MKLDDVLIIINFIFILLLAVLGVDNQLFMYNRPLFAIFMNLCIVFGIIGYSIGEEEQKQIRKQQKIIEKYFEERYGKK